MILNPCMEQDEINYFKDFCSNFDPKTKMIEWGSGGSTQLFLNYFSNDMKLISIEHNKEWFDKVTSALRDHPNRNNFDYKFIQPENPDFHGFGVPQEESPCFNENYINPERLGYKIFDADVYLVDGISRGACLAYIQAKALNRNASVFIHDYAKWHGNPIGRISWYDWACHLFSKVEVVGSTLARLYI